MKNEKFHRRCALCDRPIFTLDESKVYKITVATDTGHKIYEYDCKKCLEDAVSNAQNSTEIRILETNQLVGNQIFMRVVITPVTWLENISYEIQEKRF